MGWLTFGICVGLLVGYFLLLKDPKRMSLQEQVGCLILNDPHKGFCPPATDRGFWDGQNPKPQKITVEEFKKTNPDDSAILAVGTSQLIYYYPEQERWLLVVEESLRAFIKQPWTEPYLGKEFVGLETTQSAA